MADNGVVPTCELCAEGGIWALSVFFPGAGEVNLNCELEFTQNETDALSSAKSQTSQRVARGAASLL